MTEDIKIRLTKTNEQNLETKEGLVKTVSFVFKGRDIDAQVDWTVTIRAEDAMPVSYIKRLGKNIGNEVTVTLGKSQIQTEL